MSARCWGSSSVHGVQGRRSSRFPRCAFRAISWATRGRSTRSSRTTRAGATRSVTQAGGSPWCSATSRSIVTRSARTAGSGSSMPRGYATTVASSSARAFPRVFPTACTRRPFTRTTGSSTTIGTSTRCARLSTRPIPPSRTGWFPTTSGPTAETYGLACNCARTSGTRTTVIVTRRSTRCARGTAPAPTS